VNKTSVRFCPTIEQGYGGQTDFLGYFCFASYHRQTDEMSKRSDPYFMAERDSL
jgi:hypothetical protein